MRHTKGVVVFVAIWLFPACSPTTVSESMPRVDVNVERQAANPTVASPGSSDISSGAGIGNLRLGISYQDASTKLGKPFFDQSYEFGNCKERNAKWLVEEGGESSSILEGIFSSEGRLVQASSEGSGFATVEGITGGTSLGKFKSTYRNVQSLKLYADTGLRSNSKLVEGYSAYFVDRTRGVAFEFYKDRSEKKWKVGSISVFEPLQDFKRRRYCGNSDNENWVEFNTMELDTVPELADDR